jgi:hypothetical protein
MTSQNSFQKPRHNIIEIANENVIFQYWTEAHPTNAQENTNNKNQGIYMEQFKPITFVFNISRNTEVFPQKWHSTTYWKS